MARENRRDVALDRLQFVVGVGAGEIEEDARHLVERAPAALERLDRVGEGRRLGIGGDGVDLRARLRERRVEGRAEMARLDAVERRRLERPGPGFEKRVRVVRRTGHWGSRGSAPELWRLSRDAQAAARAEPCQESAARSSCAAA